MLKSIDWLTRLPNWTNSIFSSNRTLEHSVGTFQTVRKWLILTLDHISEPIGLDFSGNADAACILKEILKLMTPLNATAFGTDLLGGPDIQRWTKRGFPGASLMNKNEKYFWFHHTAGDSMMLEEPGNLDKAAALFAASAYVVADISVDMPRDVQ